MVPITIEAIKGSSATAYTVYGAKKTAVDTAEDSKGQDNSEFENDLKDMLSDLLVVCIIKSNLNFPTLSCNFFRRNFLSIQEICDFFRDGSIFWGSSLVVEPEKQTNN